jgi:DNA-binding transcriptional LysR family regulator
VLDAVLISVAAMTVASAPEPSDDSTLWGSDISVMPLGRRPLVLIHAAGEHCRRTGQGASEGDPNPRLRTAWELLLPPEVQQPLLWHQLERLGLLSLRDCSAGDCESWLQELLLEQAPWRDAGLRAVPPPEPLEEQLWLLLRQGHEHRPAIEALAAQLREQLIRANPAEE